MSSLSKADFIDELQARLGVSVIGSYIDIALRAYSISFPKRKVSADNDIADGLYDYPDDAISIIRIVDSYSRKAIEFTIEDQGEGDKIRLGRIMEPSYAALLDTVYYDNPLALSVSKRTTSYSRFDIEYTLLQTMATIDDMGLEAIADYVEYLALNNKASAVSVEAANSSERVAESITDQDSTGASTTIKYSSAKETSNTLRQQADEALKRFKDAAKYAAYGTRS